MQDQTQFSYPITGVNTFGQQDTQHASATFVKTSKTTYEHNNCMTWIFGM